ncbi:hypothetical protein Q3G72_032088 [Acer saccharum]|nr:hypothetical protein Q3G72_032088 [Acer saccharum]
MMNPNDNNKSKEAAKEEHLKEDAHVADNQSSTANKQKKRLAVASTSSNSTTLQIKKSKKKKGHILTIQLCQEDAHSNMAYQSGSDGGGKEVAKRGKKLAVKETYSSSSAPLKKSKKKDHFLEVQSGPPRCDLCKNKMFKTWQVVAIHMKKHKLVEARKLHGGFPPLVFTPLDGASPKRGTTIEEELAPTLLNIPQQVLLESTRLDGLFIDLNQLLDPSSLNQEEPIRLFDLNKLSPPEEKEKVEDKDHDDDQNINGGNDDAAN